MADPVREPQLLRPKVIRQDSTSNRYVYFECEEGQTAKNSRKRKSCVTDPKD